MDRLFLDANVLFSAAYAPGGGLERFWKIRGICLLASAYVVHEATRNLDDSSARERLAALVARVEIAPDSLTPLDEDAERQLPENDRPVLRAALLGRASHLVSGDRRAFGPFYGSRLAGITIVRPTDYLSRAANQTRRPARR